MAKKNVSFEDINVTSVVFNPCNLRGILRSPDQIRRLANSMMEVGLLHNPIVSYTKTGPLVIAGEQRLLAHELLVRVDQRREYQRCTCKVLEGISEEFAMKILAEENAKQGDVPAATNNEIYWHYKVDYLESNNHSNSLEKAILIWGSTSYVYHRMVVPGWLTYYCPTVQNMLAKVGPKREHLEDTEIQQLGKKLRMIPRGWWAIIASACRPLEERDLLSPPSGTDSQIFDGLLHQVFELIDSDTWGERAIEEIDRFTLPVRIQRLEHLVQRAETPERRSAAGIELERARSMRTRRGLDEREEPVTTEP